MPVFAFTVGSLGDIVSLLQIAKTVIRALCDSKGSSAEYLDLILELDSVVDTVEGVQYELSIEGPNKLPEPVENGLHHAVRRCLDLLRQMDGKISAWRRGFGSGWNFGKDAWLRLGWCIFTREELIGLRRRLSEQIEAMNTLLILAHGERLERFSRKQDEHVLDIRRKLDEHVSEVRHKQDEIVLEIRRGNIDRANLDHQDGLSHLSSQAAPNKESWASIYPRRVPQPLHYRSRRSPAVAKAMQEQKGLELEMPVGRPQTPWQPNFEYTPPPSPLDLLHTSALRQPVPTQNGVQPNLAGTWWNPSYIKPERIQLSPKPSLLFGPRSPRSPVQDLEELAYNPPPSPLGLFRPRSPRDSPIPNLKELPT